MNEVCLMIGGNLGDRFLNMKSCVQMLEKNIGEMHLISSIYETEAWGKKDQPSFLNQAVILKTMLSPEQVLEQTQLIENKLGRKREEHWGARTMDIDILFYEDKILKNSNLIIPHPLIQERRFVLAPLVEIIPQFKHPILKQKIETLFIFCTDKSLINKIDNK
jgi:2-amino-4-hydroxy-6-hydroxymethyldihydropteridine diphosphokinase